MFSTACRQLLMVFLVFSTSWAQEMVATPVPPEMLEGDALKLPVGNIGLPGPDWSWQTSDGVYIAFPDDDADPRRVVAVYLPIATPGNANDIEAMVRGEMLAGTPEQNKKASVKVVEGKAAPFGKMFNYDYLDVDGPYAGSICVAEGHTLIINVTGEDAQALREQTLSHFQPSALARDAKQASSKGFLDKTEPVPAHLLKGHELRLPGGTLSCPPGWQWRMLDSSGTKLYVCFEKQTSLIFVANSLRKEDLRGEMEQLGKGMALQTGAKIEDKVDYTPATLPFPGSEKVSMSFTLGDQELISGLGYLGYNGRQSLAILAIGVEPAAEQLDQVAGSFKEDIRRPDTFLSALSFIFGLGMLLVGFIINTVSRRPAFDAAKVAAVFSVLCMVVSMITVAKNGSYDLGRAMGGYILPLLFFAYLSGRHTKRRQAWQAQQDLPPDLPSALH